MDCIDLHNGLFLLNGERGSRCFCFISDTAFRFFSPDAPKSACVQKYVPVQDGVVVEEEGDGFCFSFEGTEVRIDSDFSLRASRLGKACLDAFFMRGRDEKVDSSLAEKEGHAGGGNTSYKGGLKIANHRPVYGLGERSGPLDKRGYDYICWNTDDPSAHVDTFKSLYQSIPFFILFENENSVGVFLDNTSATHFDFNKTEEDSVLAEYPLGEPDFYFFLGSLRKVIADYTLLTGRSQLPPYWALGAQQSRWSYCGKEEVEEVLAGYREKDIPLSVVYLDIDYMDSYKDFTVDSAKFPEISSWLSTLKEEGIRVVPIVDAGVKAEPGYEIYDEGMEKGYFCTLNGEVYHNEVWPGDSVFPAFLDPKVRMWWAVKIKRFLELGFAGIWNDMNEPASFRGPLPMEVEMGQGVKHEMAHNVYAHYMCEAGAQGFALANRRPFLLTRAGYAGTCLYSGSWAGDNQSIYDHLRLSLPQMMNMSMSGQAYIGVDIGGFGGDSTPELLTKWAIASLFNPLYRNHSSLNTKRQEPYLLHDEYLAAYKKAVEVRYEILPTLYDQLFLAESGGSIPIRPLIYNYPDDPRLNNENTEVMLGDSLLLAPSLFPGESKRNCYFPAEFLDVFTGKAYKKGDHVISVGTTDIPLFLAKNGIAVLSSPGNRKAERGDVLRLLWGGGEAKAYHFEDEGDGLGYKKGEYNLYLIEASEEKGVSLTPLHQGFESRYKKIIIDIPGGAHLEEDLA